MLGVALGPGGPVGRVNDPGRRLQTGARSVHVGGRVRDRFGAIRGQWPTRLEGIGLAIGFAGVVWLNAGGTLSWVSTDNTVQTTAALPPGTYPLLARRIRATGTTATGLTGWV